MNNENIELILNKDLLALLHDICEGDRDEAMDMLDFLSSEITRFREGELETINSKSITHIIDNIHKISGSTALMHLDYLSQTASKYEQALEERSQLSQKEYDEIYDELTQIASLYMQALTILPKSSSNLNYSRPG